jgi:hypothetical protein
MSGLAQAVRAVNSQSLQWFPRIFYLANIPLQRGDFGIAPAHASAGDSLCAILRLLSCLPANRLY